MHTNPDEPLAMLPHGPEFRFVDRLLSVEPGRFGRGVYQVRGDEPFLRGHSPGRPQMPGVLLLEAAAQLAGTVAQCDPNLPPIVDLTLTAIRHAKILGTARPGDCLELETRIETRFGSLFQARATVSVEGRLICQAELTLGGSTPALGQPAP